MERAKAVLLAIQADRERAEQIMLDALAKADGKHVAAGVSRFVAAALQGLVIDPEDL